MKTLSVPGYNTVLLFFLNKTYLAKFYLSAKLHKI